MLDKLAETIQTSLKRRFGTAAAENEPLSKHTTFGIGGPADMLVTVKSVEEMVDALRLCEQYRAEYFILGGGSNILASDSGYRGIIVKIDIDHFGSSGGKITVGSGHNLEALIDRVCSMGLGGMEMLAGIKGSIGGAVYGNAGAYGGTISDHLVSATVVRPGGQPRAEPKKYFEFSYRSSILKRTREIVLEVNFELPSDSAERLNERKNEILELRAERHPETDCSAGCFFKNIEKEDEPYGKLAAGLLLEKVGAKEARVGGAGVHVNHANIIVNLGGATAEDVSELAAMLKKRVKDRFGYTLEEEITYLGNFN